MKLELNSRDHVEYKESSRSNITNSYLQNLQESILSSNQGGVVLPITHKKIVYKHYFQNERVSKISKIMAIPEQQILQILCELKLVIIQRVNELNNWYSEGRKLKARHIKCMKEYIDKKFGHHFTI